MHHWNQSQFLQALGWATLNSFWQMAVLWYAFVTASRAFNLSATAKHRAAVSALLIGFGWACATGVSFYLNAFGPYIFFQNAFSTSTNLFNSCLLSASVAYLLLLLFPVLRLYKSWRFVQLIIKEGSQKAALTHRLFVKRIAFHLGIPKKVALIVSSLVSSPVTVGYLKPMILLPVAALNNLSTAQVEAILLHELSHIRRHDYLINFIASIIHTLLYFNPFVKALANAVEGERETCCDEMVLQFGYDKVDYASALLQLEKTSGRHKALALAAAGRHNLLTRIEKIVGMEKKKTFRLIQIVPLAFAFLCLLFFNSILLVNDVKTGKAISYTADVVFMPWQFEQSSKIKVPAIVKSALPQAMAFAKMPAQIKIDILNGQNVAVNKEGLSAILPPVENFLPVNFDDVDGGLSKEEKDTVRSAVEATKKVVTNLEWKTIEASLADVMNRREKAAVKREYLSEVDRMNWQNMEQNLKANYDQLNWEAIQQNMKMAMAQVQSDSLQNIYSMALTELQNVEKEIKAMTKIKISPLPDCSLEQLKLAKETLRKTLDSLKASKPKKTIRL